MELLIESSFSVFSRKRLFKLRSSSDPQLKWCISYLKYWMNAIHAHCKFIKLKDSDVIEPPPPVILIGTRKDKINNINIHKQISELLSDHLHHTAIWNQSLQLNEDDGLNFFPIDNTMSINDNTGRKVVTTMNNSIINKPYVTKQIPLTWLQLVDHMNMLKDHNNKSFISMNELISISNNYGINEDVLCDILIFLNEMSYLLWNKDPSLRDIIIFDPIDYLIKPVTNIISNHTDDSGENRIQHSELQQRAKLRFPSDWNRFVSEGIASIDLISFLLSEYSDRLSVLMLLMEKFGLMVQLNPSKYDVMNGVDGNNNNNNNNNSNNNNKNNNSSKGNNDCKLYLFPSIIPNASSRNDLAIIQRWSSVQQKHIVHFVFTAREEVLSIPIIRLSALSYITFCPVGFFHRLVGKVLTWCLEIQHVSSSVPNFMNPNNQIIYGDKIELTFINQQFLMQLSPERNCLEVMIEGENPLAIHRRLKNQINEVIRESFPKLHVIDAVAYPYGSSILHNKNNKIVFIPLSNLTSSIKNNDTILIIPERIRPDILRQTYHSWIPPSVDTPFDVFISYRWNDYDSKLTKKMFDILSSFNQLYKNKTQALRVFRDVEILYDGANLKESFSSSLLKSKLFVPIISYNALQRLVNHDVNVVDNMLIEWFIAIELSSPHHRSNANIRIRGIYPIFIHNEVDVTCSDWPIGEEVEEKVISSLVRHKDEVSSAPSSFGAKLVTNTMLWIAGQGYSVTSSSSSFSVGDIVESNYHNKGKWFSGVVKSDRGNGAYDVQYDGCDLLMKRGGVLDSLPNIIPTKTIERASQLLRDQGIEPRPTFFTMTVKGVLDGIQEFLYQTRWDYDRREIKICEGILDVLKNKL
eukprot:gene7050-9625_t